MNLLSKIICRSIFIPALSFISVAVFALSAPVFAYQDTTEERYESDKEELRNLLANFTSFEADFSQSISDEEGKELQQSSGKLSLLAPNKLRWETQLPDETLLIADGSAVWNIDPFVEQVTVLQQSDVTKNNPLMLLINDSDEQWQSVMVKKEGDSFSIKSLDETANIGQLDIVFDNGILKQLTSYDRQLQKSLLIFSNEKQNKTITNEYFEFTVPPTFIIDDQRSQN